MTIHMACNNPDNGLSLYRCEAVEIHGPDEFSLTFEGPAIVTRLRDDGRLQFGTFIIPIRSYKNWVGNWCWDAAGVVPKQAMRAVNYMIQRRWQCTEGPSEVYDYLHGNDRIVSKYERRYFTKEKWENVLRPYLPKKGGAA